MKERCFICGEENPNVLESHHIIPRRHGGSDDRENIVRLCANCHRGIERMYDRRFYRQLGLLDRKAESEEESSEGVVSRFVEAGVEYNRGKSVKRKTLRQAFNGYLTENGLEPWNFDDHAVMQRFGRLLNANVPDDVERTTKHGERADKYLALTDVGERYYQS